MNVVLESQPNCLVTLQVELSPDRVAKEREAVSRQFQRQARVPGYRPGKAPQSLIDTRFAKDIRDEVTSKLLRESLDEAIREKKLRVISVSKVEDVKLEDNNTMRFRATVLTAPDFELPDYSAITVEIAKPAVTDEKVSEWLEQLRDPHATYEPVEGRPLAMGDYPVVTYSASLDGKPLAEVLPGVPQQIQGRKNAWIFMDKGTIAPGFCAALEGLKIEEEKSFDVEYPGDFPLKDLHGKKVSYSVRLHAINKKNLPAIDDELAAKIDPGSNLEQLRGKIRERIEQMADSEFLSEKRRSALNILLSKMQCELPTAVVQREMSGILREIVHENQVRGVSDDELKSHQDELVGAAQRSATERVRGNFLLMRIAEKENLQVAESDMISAVTNLAARYEIPVKKLIKDLQRRDGFTPLREQILMGKALDLITANVTVREPAPDQSTTA